MLRLSLAYALLDGSAIVREEHIKAAHAVWTYCEASAAYIFGAITGDPVADRLREAIREAGEEGLTYTQQYELFGRHQSRDRLDVARTTLEFRGEIVTDSRPTAGRPTAVSRIAH